MINKKKILIISASFYTEISPRSFRTTELAKELARQGHYVNVYIPKKGQDFSMFEVDHKLIIKDLGPVRWKQLCLKGWKIELLVRRAIRRALQVFFEWPDIEFMFKVSRILKSEKNYNILISIAVPHPIHWGVAKARTKVNRIADTWIADCGDPYMGDRVDSFRKLFYFKYIEKWFCRKADFISIPFEGARSAYYPEFHNKIKVIPQGFRLDNLKIPEYKKIVNYSVFAYAGVFIRGKRDPTALLNFLAKCKRSFKFIIYTSQTDMLLPFKQLLQDKLEIRDYIPRNDLIIALSGMDFLINFDNNTNTQLPSKLIDYAIT